MLNLKCTERDKVDGIKKILIDKKDVQKPYESFNSFFLFHMFNARTPWLRVFNSKKYDYKFSHCDYTHCKNWEMAVGMLSTTNASKILYVNDLIYRYRSDSNSSTISKTFNLSKTKKESKKEEEEKKDFCRIILNEIEVNQTNFEILTYTFFLYSLTNDMLKSVYLEIVEKYIKSGFLLKDLNHRIIFMICKTKKRLLRVFFLNLFLLLNQ
ncbi:MAG: hypothetical protein ACRC4M_00205 [Mycoplasma sp.]